MAPNYFPTQKFEQAVATPESLRCLFPGAFEIPLHTKFLSRAGRYQTVVAAGLMADRGIYRHEFVTQTVVAVVMQFSSR